MLEDFITAAEADQLKKDCFNLIEEMNPAEHQTIFSTTSQVQMQQIDVIILLRLEMIGVICMLWSLLNYVV